MPRTIDPDTQCRDHGCARWRCDESHPGLDLSVRPTHVSHPAISQIVREMRAANRVDLIHYAGASYRDDIAWQVCNEWVCDPSASKATLMERALAEIADSALVEATESDR